MIFYLFAHLNGSSTIILLYCLSFTDFHGSLESLPVDCIGFGGGVLEKSPGVFVCINLS